MRVSTEGSRAVTARRVSSVRSYPLAGAMSPLLLFVPLSLRRSSYLGMPEEYRAAFGWIGVTTAFGYRSIDPIGVEAPACVISAAL